MTTPPPAGWYPPSPPAQPARITIHYGFALLAVFSLLGTLIPTLIMFVAAGNVANDPNAYDPSASAGIGTGMAILWMLWGGMWTLVWAAFAINHTLKERRRNS
jgi:hypothetical protein